MMLRNATLMEGNTMNQFTELEVSVILEALTRLSLDDYENDETRKATADRLWEVFNTLQRAY